MLHSGGLSPISTGYCLQLCISAVFLQQEKKKKKKKKLGVRRIVYNSFLKISTISSIKNKSKPLNVTFMEQVIIISPSVQIKMEPILQNQDQGSQEL